jgi:hypothetical protein
MNSVPPEPQKTEVSFPLLFGGVFVVIVVVLGAWVAWRPKTARNDENLPKVEQVNPPDLAGPGGKGKNWQPGKPLSVSHEEDLTEAREVPRTPTPLSEVDIAKVLISAHQIVFESEPQEQRLSVAWAHIALEHSRGKDIECNNFGNIILPDGVPGEFYQQMTTERTRKNHLARPEKWEAVNMHFRAFSTPIDGAVYYWKLIRDQYTDALAYFDQGNGFLAGRRLGERGYMTAEAQGYAQGLGSLQQEFFVRVRPQLALGAPQ